VPRGFFVGTPFAGAAEGATLLLLAATLGARLTLLLSPIDDTLDAMLMRRETVRDGTDASEVAKGKSAIVCRLLARDVFSSPEPPSA
jgi:hypothetical protein